jgi:hypothetical protein
VVLPRSHHRRGQGLLDRRADVEGSSRPTASRSPTAGASALIEGIVDMPTPRRQRVFKR